jgi:hypothetical protein
MRNKTRLRLPLSTWWLVALALGPSAARAQQPAVPSLRAGRAEAIHLDGRLDEPAWAAADSIPDLRQVEPQAGVEASMRTVVRVLASPSEIIVGIVAYDPEPSRIVSYTKARDGELDEEDYVGFVLDTFGDGRTGFIFAVNPGGARLDALVSNRGEDENVAWDAIWEAATARSPDGWSAEFRIPVKSLIYGQGLTTWGMNVQRQVVRLQEVMRWASPSPDIEIGQTSRAGLLTGLPEFDLGLGLAVRPALTVGGDNSFDSDVETTFHPSLDLTQRIAGGILASLTLNTDFAETEVDTRQTNLTRFPIRFPEKRSFFLEGDDVFEFGLGLGDQLIPFFSRRVGLVGGEQVPLRVGGKINGQVGGTSVGALATRTGGVNGVAPATTMGVVRLKQNVLGESSAGLLATVGDPLGREDAWMAGADFTYQNSRFTGDKNLLVGVYGLVAGRADLGGDRSATGLKVDYPNDLWDIALTYNRIGDGFDPSLGFVPRPGTNQLSGGVSYRPRINRAGFRQCFFQARPSWTGDLGWNWESWRLFTAPAHCQMESGDLFEFNWVPQGERLEEPFEVADGVLIPAGSYHFNRFRVEVEFASKRRISGTATWWFGEFYDGTLHQLEGEVLWRPSGWIVVELSGERNVGTVSGGSFTEDLVGGRVNLNLSPDLVISTFVQYDNDSKTIGSNTRLRWTFDPLGALFLVYNHNLRRLISEDWGYDTSQLRLKVEYTLRY